MPTLTPEQLAEMERTQSRGRRISPAELAAMERAAAAPDRPAGIGLSQLVTGEPRRAPVYSEHSPAPFGDRLLSGAAKGAAGFQGLVARGLRGAYRLLAPPQLGMLPELDALAEADYGAAADEVFRGFTGRAPPPPPATFVEHVTENVGGGLATPTLGAPGGGTLPGLALEAGGLLAGSTAGELVERAGGGPIAQIAAAVPASMAPGIAGAVLGRHAARANARIAADEVAEAMSERAAQAGGAGLAAVPASTPSSLMRASSELKAMIPEGFEAEAAQRLDEAVQAFPNPQARPVTSQVLDDLGGSQIEAATMSLDRGDRTISRRLAGAKTRAVRAIDAEVDALRPAGDFTTAQQSYDEIAEAAAKAEREAWQAVPMKDMPRVKTADLKNAAAEIRASAGRAGASNLPGELSVIDDYGKTVPFAELQALRSELLTTIRAGRSPTASAQAQRQAAHAARLIGSPDAPGPVEQLINSVAESAPENAQGVSALREAHRLTRQNRELFDPRSPVVRAFEQPKEAQTLARALIAGGPQESRRALSIFKSNPAGQESVRRVVMDELIGPDVLTEGGAKAAMKRLREKREMAVALFGSEHVQNVEKLLRKAKTVRSGRAGTRAAALGTGSNTLASDAVTALESGMEMVGQRGGSLGARIWDASSKATVGRVTRLFKAEHSRIMAAALIDPALARDLLNIPGPAALPKWATRMEGHFARNGIRLATPREEQP